MFGERSKQRPYEAKTHDGEAFVVAMKEKRQRRPPGKRGGCYKSRIPALYFGVDGEQVAKYICRA